MELDEFKQLYKEIHPEETARHSAGELEGYMRSKNRSITAKVKRSIVFELILSMLFVIAAAWVWWQYTSSLVRPFAMLTIALCCIFFVYLGSLYSKITAYEKSPPAVIDSLHQVIVILQQFTRLYFRFTMITLPVLFSFGLILGYLYISGNGGMQHFNWTRGIGFYTGWFMLWWAFMYFFTKWYIKKLYGNYLLQLQQQLKDIENG